MRKLMVGDVLIKSRDSMTVEDEIEYRQVTVRLKHQGVCLRGYKLGKEIGTKQQSYARAGQFILSKIDARNGAFGIIPDELDGAIVTNDFLTYDVNEKELNIELFRLLTSQPKFDDICNKASTGTTNRKRLSEREFLAQEIIVPPIEEQDAFIAHFKKLQFAQEQTLAELQTQADLIAKLCASILSDAVRGRLMPQDPNDEPANTLLEKIRDEKERLIKEGIIKRDKPLPPIVEDEIPHELPANWSWARIGDIALVRGGKRVSQGYKLLDRTTPYIYIRVTDMKNGSIIDHDLRYLDESEYNKIKQYTISKDDLYITIAGTIGQIGIVPDKFDGMNLTENAAKISLFLVSKQYLHVALNSPCVQKQFMECVNKMAQPKLSLDSIRNAYIPLPSVNEQHRIVSKVEELMATCVALEAEIAKSRTETDRLMQTILKEAFE